MTNPLILLLDLGDLLTKGLALSPAGDTWLRFPSAVASRLLSDEDEPAPLLLGDPAAIPRPAGFDLRNHPRARSFTGAGAVVLEALSGRHPTAGARFTGVLAATCGADRVILGSEPTARVIDALVRRALMLTVRDERRVELVLVLGAGASADAIERYAEAAPPSLVIRGWNALRSEPRHLELSVGTHIVDAAACAVAALPPELDLARLQRLLLVDIGYLRTSLTIVSTEGCEYQEQLDGIGVCDCVRRILRDEQEQGLVEDEFAVIRALERPGTAVEVAGRRFEIGRSLMSAQRSLEEEIARSAGRVVMDHFARRGDMCRGMAIFGGGAALIGRGLAARLASSDLHMTGSWVSTNPEGLLVQGARHAHRVAAL